MDDRRRCTAKSTRSHERCKKAAINGGTVCRSHGGAAPQVKLAAAERLKALQDPALTRLEAMLTSDVMMLTKPEVVARVGLGVLDRTGLGPHSTVNVEGSLGERLARLDEPSD